MPTSYHGYITDVITEVRKLQPKSILDIGVGFGKWGHLFREYLDVMHGRPFKKDWEVVIDGIEIYKPYIMAHQEGIYDDIYNEDVVDFVKRGGLNVSGAWVSSGSYDLIFTSDVLEHIEKQAALELIDKIRKRCKTFIAIIPMGPKWLGSQGSMYGNDHEAHISQWDGNEPGFKEAFVRQYICNTKPINMYIFK